MTKNGASKYQQNIREELIRQIPNNKIQAIRWLERLYMPIISKQKRGAILTGEEKEMLNNLKIVRDEVCKRFNFTPEDILKAINAEEEARRKEDENFRRMMEDPSCWKDYNL